MASMAGSKGGFKRNGIKAFHPNESKRLEQLRQNQLLCLSNSKEDADNGHGDEYSLSIYQHTPTQK
jgi:hypothetical protein